MRHVVVACCCFFRAYGAASKRVAARRAVASHVIKCEGNGNVYSVTVKKGAKTARMAYVE